MKKFLLDTLYTLCTLNQRACLIGHINYAHDKLINDLIDNDAPVVEVNEYTHLLGDYLLWTVNYPYAYGQIHKGDNLEVPHPRTVARLRSYLYERTYIRK